MARALVDKNVIFLVVIIAVIAGATGFMVLSLRTDPVEEAIKADRILTVAIILEQNGKPMATQLFMYYPGNSRAAMLDVPSETGLIIKSLNRVDRIDVLYNKKSPGTFLAEIASLTGAEIDWYLILDEQGLSDLADLLDGFTVFQTTPVATIVNDKPVRLPSGMVTLDGLKTIQYASWVDPETPESELVSRRQALFQAILRRIAEKHDFIDRDDVYPYIQHCFRSNLSPDSLGLLLGEFSKLEADRVVMQRITGAYRSVEGSLLLFPYYDGELAKDIVKQSLNALLNADSTAIADKVFTVEILNGTTSRGLAQKTAEIFQSFGYEVVSVGNAGSFDIEQTSIVDRYGDRVAAGTLANVIRCKIIEDDPGLAASPADFVIILGKDFNGRNCVY